MRQAVYVISMYTDSFGMVMRVFATTVYIGVRLVPIVVYVFTPCCKNIERLWRRYGRYTDVHRYIENWRDYAVFGGVHR